MGENLIIALSGALSGGIGLKIIEHLLNRGTKEAELLHKEASDIRDELRKDIANFREENRGLRDEVRQSSARIDDLEREIALLKADNLAKDREIAYWKLLAGVPDGGGPSKGA